VLTLVTYSKGPDSHEWYGCSVPLSLWSLFLFISTTAYYTSDFMHRGQQEGERMERYVYDPKVSTSATSSQSIFMATFPKEAFHSLGLKLWWRGDIIGFLKK
jgi:hypothetical protein